MVGGIGDSPRIAGAPQRVGIGEAAKAFEALFIEKFLEFGNRPLAGIQPVIGGGSAERNYRQLFLREMASRVVERSVTPEDLGDNARGARRVSSPFGLAAQIIRAAGEGASRPKEEIR